MSLLMEALRKAEAAKSKVTQEQQAEAIDTAGEAVGHETPPQQVNIDTPTSEDSPLTMVPMEPIDSIETAEPPPSLEAQFQTETTISKDNNLDHQQYNSENKSKQTASALFQAKRPSQESKSRQRLALAALILILPLGGAFYWLYSENASSSYPVYSTVPSATAERGFLGETVQLETTKQTPNAEPALIALLPSEDRAIESETLVSNTPKQEQSSETLIETIIESSSSTSVATPDSSINQLRLTRTNSVAVVTPNLQAAFESYQQGDLLKAQKQYQAVLSQQTNSRDAMLGLASVHLKQRDIAQAQAIYSSLLKLNPKDPLARAGLLETSQAVDPAQQESELKSLLSQHPNLAPLAFALGNLYASQNRWSEAQSEYFNALKIAKSTNAGAISPDYAFNLAIGLERLNQPKPAYTYYKDALELSRYSPPGFDIELLNSRLAYLEGILQ